MKRLDRYSFSALLAVCMLLMPVFSAYIGAETVTVTLFHVNDVHANIDHFARIAHVVNTARKRNPDTYLLNMGDNFSGNPIVDQAEPRGEPLRIIFNKLGFDLMVLGNHDFDYGRELLKRFLRKSTFKTILANVEDPDKLLPLVSATAEIKTKSGVSIGFFGLVQIEPDTGIPSTHPKNVRGLRFSNEFETAAAFSHLKKKHDAVILMSHMGIEKDIQVAEKNGWIDLIIGGHSHTIVTEPKPTNGVLITQAGDTGRYLGRIDLVFEKNRLIKRSGKLIDISKVRWEDPEVRRLIDHYNDNRVLNKVVADIPHEIEGKRALGNMVCDAIRDIGGIDFALMNRGGIRIKQLNKRVRVKDIYRMHPFKNEIVRFKLNANEIRSLIAAGFNKSGRIDLYVSGFRYKIYKTGRKKEGIKKIELLDSAGKALDESRTYTVAINNYIASTYHLKNLDKGRVLNKTLAQVVLDFIEKGKIRRNYKDLKRTSVELFINADMVPIATVAVALNGDDSYQRSSSAGNLICDAVRAELKTDIAFYPSRNVKRNIRINAGRALYREMLPMIYSYSERNRVISGLIRGSDLLKFMRSRSRFRNNVDLQVSGIKYQIQLTRDHKVAALRVFRFGREIDPSKWYRAAFPDYEFRKYYRLEKKIREIKKSKQTIMDIVADYIQRQKIVPAGIAENRIKLLQAGE